MIQHTILELKRHLANDKIEDALSILIQELDDNHEFIAHKATLHRNTDALDQGIISFSDINLIRTKVIYSVLKRLDKISNTLNSNENISYRGIQHDQSFPPDMKSFLHSQFQHILIDLDFLFPSSSPH